MDDIKAMELAIAEAKTAAAAGDVPIGAVIVSNGELIGAGHNIREYAQDPLGHAEIQAIQQASERFDSWRITDSTIYVTLEPCLMCAGAIFASRIERVVFSAFDSNSGVFGSVEDLSSQNRMNHTLEVEGGLLEETGRKLILDFFAEVRKKDT